MGMTQNDLLHRYGLRRSINVSRGLEDIHSNLAFAYRKRSDAMEIRAMVMTRNDVSSKVTRDCVKLPEEVKKYYEMNLLGIPKFVQMPDGSFKVRYFPQGS